MSDRDVRVYEVGPRDGLQNDPRTYPAAAKVAFIETLAAAGLPVIEAASFVSPAAIPQLADSGDVMRHLTRQDGVRYVALVPNERGYDRAVAAGVDAIALFASATEEFSQANLRASIEDVFGRFVPVANRAIADRCWMRGYVSVAFACPYAGRTDPRQTLDVAQRLIDLGCSEIALADTIGVAEPDDVHRLLDVVLTDIPPHQVALHFHDTNGRALANVDAALEYGIATFDGSAGGLGGCPYAPGAPGNLATELLVDHLATLGIETGVDAERIRQMVRALIRQLSD